MVQFLSIIFLSWISSIFVGFFKRSRFLCQAVHAATKQLQLFINIYKFCHDGMTLTGKNRNTVLECRGGEGTITLTITNSKRIGLESKLHPSDKPATKRLSHGTARNGNSGKAVTVASCYLFYGVKRLLR